MAAQCTQLHTPHRALAYDALVRGVSLVRFGSSLFVICDGEAEVVRFRAPTTMESTISTIVAPVCTYMMSDSRQKRNFTPAARGADTIANPTNGGF